MSTLMSISRSLALRVSGLRVSGPQGHLTSGVPDLDPEPVAVDAAVDAAAVARLCGTSERDGLTAREQS
jgi:hypothetical protein